MVWLRYINYNILNLLDKYELGEMKWDSTQNYYMVQKPEIR